MTKINNTLFYYIDDNGKKVFFDTKNTSAFDGGNEGSVYKVGGLAIKVIEKFSISFEEADYFRTFTNLKRTRIPKHILFSIADDSFAGYTDLFLSRINRIANFKCSNFLRDYLNILDDVTLLAAGGICTCDSIDENFLFDKDNLYLLDCSRWYISEPNSKIDIEKDNRYEVAEGIAQILTNPLRVGTNIAIAMTPFCDALIKNEESPLEFHKRLSKELGSYPTFGDYSINKKC